MTGIEIVPEFSWVLFVSCGIGLQVLLQGFAIGRLRKRLFNKAFFKKNFPKLNEKEYPEGGYPDMGSGLYAHKLPYEDWVTCKSSQHLSLSLAVCVSVCLSLSLSLSLSFFLSFSLSLSLLHTPSLPLSPFVRKYVVLYPVALSSLAALHCLFRQSVLYHSAIISSLCLVSLPIGFSSCEAHVPFRLGD